MPDYCLFDAKRLLHTDEEIEIMKKVNHNECVALCDKWNSPKLMPILMKFFSRDKSKLWKL